MIRAYPSTVGKDGDCNFCVPETRDLNRRVWMIQSSSPHRISLVRTCDTCLSFLQSIEIPDESA